MSCVRRYWAHQTWCRTWLCFALLSDLLRWIQEFQRVREHPAARQAILIACHVVYIAAKSQVALWLATSCSMQALRAAL